MSIINRMKPTLAATAILLTMTSAGALAEGLTAKSPKDQTTMETVINKDGTLTLEGTVQWVDLEGGYYQVNGWALMGDQQVFASLAGKSVIVSGTEFDGISIRMVKTLVVSTIEPKDGKVPVPPVEEPVAGSLKVEGTLEQSNLEGRYYSVAGWGLIGDEAVMKSVLGKHVIVTGTEYTGVSANMVRMMKVESILLPVPATHSKPGTVMINGKQVPPGQESVVVDGVLMVPLRAVVQTAGGRVDWNAKEQMVVVTLPDRMAYFWIDKNEAELNENNVRYLRRNLLPLERSTVILRGRTFVSADALTKILGLVEVADVNQSMDLTFVQ